MLGPAPPTAAVLNAPRRKRPPALPVVRPEVTAVVRANVGGFKRKLVMPRRHRHQRPRARARVQQAVNLLGSLFLGMVQLRVAATTAAA